MRKNTKLIVFGIVTPLVVALSAGALFVSGAFGESSFVDDVILPYGAFVIPVIVAISTSYWRYSGSWKSCVLLSTLFPGIMFFVIFIAALMVESSPIGLTLAVIVFLFLLLYLMGAGCAAGSTFVIARYVYRRLRHPAENSVVHGGQ